MRVPRLITFVGGAAATGPSARRAGAAPAGGGIQPAACNEIQLRTLQAEVARWCKGESTSCRNVNDCDELIERADTNSRCAAARRDINTICFDGGDEGHQEAERRALVARNTCLTRFVDNCRGHEEFQIVVDFLRLHPIT